jgi:hypothetical protein
LPEYCSAKVGASAPPAIPSKERHAECVLRNRAKFLVVRLQQTRDDAARRRILNQALLGA